jgi:PTS system nitrogen regulatory IIA component
MPYRYLSVDEAARYLHLTRGDIERLVKEQAIPFERRGERTVFRKDEIDAWASQRILGLADRHLADYHQKSTRGTREILPHEAMMAELIRPEFIEPALTAKTKTSVLRGMVALAEKTGRLNDPRALLAGLEAREALCTTALPGGMALLHPRVQQPYLFESSFIVVGRALQEIHFGAPDGQPTDLFFLICSQDDRIHLHTLARLCLMAQKTDALARLRQAPDAPSMHECLLASEAEALQARSSRAS